MNEFPESTPGEQLPDDHMNNSAVSPDNVPDGAYSTAGGYHDTGIVPSPDDISLQVRYAVNPFGIKEADTPNEYPLTDWGNVEPKGKVEGSEWVNPVNGLPDLDVIHRLGGTVSDEDVRIFADGRDQHLELFQLPDGYDFIRIIDSTTGEVLTGQEDTYRYGGSGGACSCGEMHNTGILQGVLLGRTVSLDGGKVVSGILGLDEGMRTSINPIEVGSLDPDYFDRMRTGLTILPDAQELYIHADTRTGIPGGIRAELAIRTNRCKTTGQLIVYQANTGGDQGQLVFDLGGAGNIEKAMIHQDGMLEELGIRGKFPPNTGGWATIYEPAQQQKIADALAEALGMERWTGLDLKLTASGLYKAMGRRNFDVTSVFVPRS